MSNTIELVRCLGTPLLNGGKPFVLRESQELLDTAFDNRVELIYLENLKRAGMLDKLAPRLAEFEQRRQKTNECIVRIAKAMDKQGIEYSITKSLRPYPAIPNDTDMLYLGPLNQYSEAVRRFEVEGFVISGGGAMQTELFDPHGEGIFNKEKRGGMYYIDFYRQLAADHVPYMNSAVLRQHVITRRVDGMDVKVFDPIAEMTILYLHSIIMHRTIPLEVMWSTAYWMAEMNSEDFNQFERYIRANHAVISSRTIFGLMSRVYEQAFGEIPAQLREMISRFGERRAEKLTMQRNGDAFPHIALFSTFCLSVFEKILEWNSFKGFMKQLAMMLNPLFFAEVVHHLFNKARIKKHFRHV